MKFLWVTIAVNNMEKSLYFYQEIVGLKVSRRFTPGPGREIVFLGEGETQVELIHDSGHPAPGRVDGLSLGFEVQSLDDMMAFVKGNGVEVEGGVIQPNPHIRFFYARDPDGVRIQFSENL